MIDAAAGADQGRLRSASARFLRPPRPGAALHTRVDRTADGARFEGRDRDSNAVLAGSATTA